MTNTPSVSIGIAAHNAEKNIGRILESLFFQAEDGFSIQEIIVHCDDCNDKTLQISQSFNQPKIKIVENKNRKGFAGSVKALLEAGSGDIIVLLNDDIKIDDPELIKKIIVRFPSSPKVGMVFANPRPLAPRSFIEAVILSSFNAWDNMRQKIRNGRNIFCVDGKVMAFSRSFVSAFRFPDNLKQMGNVDAFFYMACVAQGFSCEYAREARVYYRNPSTFSDYVEWVSRNNSNQGLLRKQFGQLVDKEYAKPFWLYTRCVLAEFVKNPLAGLFIFFSRFYINHLAEKKSKNFIQTWKVIETSKDLN